MCSPKIPLERGAGSWEAGVNAPPDARFQRAGRLPAVVLYSLHQDTGAQCRAIIHRGAVPVAPRRAAADIHGGGPSVVVIPARGVPAPIPGPLGTPLNASLLSGPPLSGQGGLP